MGIKNTCLLCFIAHKKVMERDTTPVMGGSGWGWALLILLPELL